MSESQYQYVYKYSLNDYRYFCFRVPRQHTQKCLLLFWSSDFFCLSVVWILILQYSENFTEK